MRLLSTVLFSIFYVFLFSQTEATLLGRWSDDDLPTNFFGRYNEIWGHAVDGREYAIIGSTFGTHFIDITDPMSPVEVVRVEGGQSGSSIFHRDYHNYGNYLYAVADEGSASTLQVMDMSHLPDTVLVVYDSSNLFINAHNIFIDTAKARLYVLISTTATNFWPMQLYDISSPLDPQLLGSYNVFGGIPISQVHDAFIKNDTAFLNCANTGLLIVNFADPENPELISSLLEYPDQGYNHSGWATPDMNHYYMADETFRTRIKNIDISNISEPEVIAFTNVRDTVQDELPHNPIWHCNHLFVASYYDMLQVYDVSDPTASQRVLFFDDDDGPNNGQFRGAWGIYPFLPSGNIILSSINTGLYVFEGLGLTDCDGSVVSSSEEHSKNVNVSVYPNPSNGYYYIEIEEYGKYSVGIYDSIGRKVSTLSYESGKPLDLSSLANGVYSVLVFDDQEFIGQAQVVKIE